MNLICRPKTRGDLKRELIKGTTCEVAVHVAAMTAIMLRGWLKFSEFAAQESFQNPGWAVFYPLSLGKPNMKIIDNFETKNVERQNVIVETSRNYSNGRTCIQIMSTRGASLMTASVNLPDHDLPDGHVFIKDYNENEGVAAALIKAGFIEPTDVVIDQGFVSIRMYKLLI